MNAARRARRLPLLGLLLAVLASATDPAEAGRPAPEVAAALDAAGGDHAAAARALEASVEASRPSVRAELLLHAGEQHRLAGDPDAARAAFRQVIGDKRGDRFVDAARLGLALMELQPGSDDGLQILITVAPTDALDSQNADRFAFLAERADAEGRLEERDAHAARARVYAAADARQADAIDRRVQAISARAVSAPRPTDPVLPPPVPPEDRPTRVPRPDPAPPLAPPTGATPSLRAAREALAAGDRETARAAAERLRDATDEATRAGAAALLRATDGVAVDPDRIGVLLPLSGRFAAVAGHVREALEDGWSHYDTEVELVFRDSGATAESAVTALDRLVLDQGVIAVLGPLLTEEAVAVAARAESLAVPLVTLSQEPEQPAALDWVYQAWLTPHQQVEVLLDHVFAKGRTRFAVFAPDNDYGRRATEAFVAGVARRGGAVAATVHYTAGAADLTEPARTLAGSLGGELLDAIFVPDGAARVSLAAAGLAYEELPIGTFTPGGKDPIPLLGLSAWNADSLVTAGGIYTRNGLFTDVYVGPPSLSGLEWTPTPAWREFTERLQERTGRTPTAIEALASDAGRVVGAAAALRPRTRLAFREALLEARPASSVTGVTGFSPESHALGRTIQVLRVTRSGFIIAE